MNYNNRSTGFGSPKEPDNISPVTTCIHQTSKADTQSAYLGITSRADLIKAVGLMSNKRDPRAPIKPDAEDLENKRLENHPKPPAPKVKQNRPKTILKTECWTVADAKAL